MNNDIEYFEAVRTPNGICEVRTNVGVLDKRLDLANHSPSGFEWGYSGSGPAQLAVAMCAALVGDERALKVYQHFKQIFLADLEMHSWRMSAESCLEIIEAIEVTQSGQ